MATAAIANPTSLSPPTALASQKPVASHFPSSFRPLSSTSSSSSSSSAAAYALHNLHRIAKPWLPIIPRKLDAPLVHLEAAAVTDAEAELAEGEAASDSAVATAPPPSKPKTGKAALPLKRDRTRSKRFLEIQKLRENKKEYDVPTAVSLLKQTSNTKFVESAEAHFRLNIDPKYNDQQLRATVNLPKGTGQTVKVAVLTQVNGSGGNTVGIKGCCEDANEAPGVERLGCLLWSLRGRQRCLLRSLRREITIAEGWKAAMGCDWGQCCRGLTTVEETIAAAVFYKAMVERRRYGERIDEAKNAGADIVGGEELILQIKDGFMDFDKLIASPDMMPKVASLGKLLGPRGLMPNPKAGTVTTDIPQAIQEFKKGKVEYRVDKTGIVHLPFGKINFSDEDLIVNLMAAVRSIEANKPSGAKGVYWKSAHICSSMGPSIRLNIREMLDYKPPAV
ncbi:Ribosomal protein L1p/L10e family [Musa troglodytarum]|uniref:Large ribosomal subunit protein uL1c n=1 Tax=Musa troglodytarum TaxID=320322 RepID=A0A9E7EMJ0_9LILI|nr:Ribosomal protein L1p/L10e family [Musa troglodytarum]